MTRFIWNVGVARGRVTLKKQLYTEILKRNEEVMAWSKRFTYIVDVSPQSVLAGVTKKVEELCEKVTQGV